MGWTVGKLEHGVTVVATRADRAVACCLATTDLEHVVRGCHIPPVPRPYPTIA